MSITFIMETQRKLITELEAKINTQKDTVRTLKMQKANKKVIMTAIDTLLLLKSQLAAEGGPLICTCSFKSAKIT